MDEKQDELHIAAHRDMDPAQFDFIDYTMNLDPHENFDDIVE